MADENSVRQWITNHGDWMGVAQLIALMVGSVVAYMQGTRGMAVLFSHIAASVSSLVLFMAGQAMGYSSLWDSLIAGVVGGGLGVTLFKLLIAVSNRVDRDKDALAKKIVDTVPLPGGVTSDTK